MKALLPLPDNTFAEMVEPWIEIVGRSESASILNLSVRSQLYRVSQLLENKTLLKTKLGNLKKIKFVVINLTTLSLDNSDEAEQFFIKKRAKYGKTVFFIIDADRLLDEKKELLGVINALPYLNRPVSILFFFKKNIQLQKYIVSLAHFATLLQNIIVVPLFSKESMLHYIKYEAALYKIEIPKLLSDEIVNQCGGRMWLIKQAIRRYRTTGSKKDIFNHEDMQFRLKTIFNEFEPEEKEVLIKIVNRKSNFDTTEKEILSYLDKTGLIVKNKHLSLTIPLLEEYIRKENNQQYKFYISKKNEIKINNLTINSVFSRSQKKLLIYFISHSNVLLARDLIARIMWDDNDYTDWAIDTAINRLRNKLINLGLNRELIITVRNQGFIFKI